MDPEKPRPVNQLREDRKGVVNTGTTRGCKPRYVNRPAPGRAYTTDSTAGLKPASYWR
jgi:hypothetical protein